MEDSSKNSNQLPSYELVVPPKKKKKNAKRAYFMLFINEKGKNLFFQKYGIPLNIKNQEHMSMVSEFWMELSDEERQVYKERNKILSKPTFQNNYYSQNKSNSQNQYTSTSNGPNLERIEQFRRANTTSSSNLPILHENILKRRKLDRNHLKNVFSFRSLGNPYNFLLNNSTFIQLISIFPIVFAYKKRFHKIATYPAEISITRFNVRNGILSQKTIFVQFDKNSFYGINAKKDDENEQINARKYLTTCLGIHFDGPAEGLTPEEAHNWVMSNLNSNDFLLCDFNQYTWVTRGLETLAMIAGKEAQREFKNKIENHIMTIQDFAQVTLEQMPLDSPNILNHLNSNQIEQKFNNNRLQVCHSQQIKCEFHRNWSINRGSPVYQCCNMHNLRLIHILFQLYYDYYVQDFRRVFSPTIHFLCVEQSVALAELPAAFKIKLSSALSSFQLKKENNKESNFSNSSESEKDDEGIEHQEISFLSNSIHENSIFSMRNYEENELDQRQQAEEQLQPVLPNLPETSAQSEIRQEAAENDEEIEIGMGVGFALYRQNMQEKANENRFLYSPKPNRKVLKVAKVLSQTETNRIYFSIDN